LAPLADVRAFLAHAKASDKTPQAALADVPAIEGLSTEGAAALLRLATDLSSVDFKTGPGSFLCDMLFNHPTYLRPYLTGEAAADQQRRLAIHQFLQFAVENNTSDGGDPKRKMLDWIRRLEVFGDERALREPPAAVEGIDAVRLMTVHASKGLEFKVVHLPALGAGMFPLRWQGERCPAPQSMLTTLVADDHKEEEECLFFVALSRARDHLSLSRAQRYSLKQASNASEALRAISSYLPRSPDASPTWSGHLPVQVDFGDRRDLCVTTREHDGRDIEVYLGCPRRYLYQIVLGLSGSREDNGYIRFHRAVYRVLHWMGSQALPIIASEQATAFEAAWHDIGPFDHPLEPLYRAAAGRILDLAASRSRSGITYGETLEITIDGHTISIPVDEMDRTGGGVVVRRLRTGRPPKSPDQRALHALMAEAGRRTHAASFELLYLTTNTPVSPALSGVMADRLGKTSAALAALAAGRYPAEPQNREDCPRCPHYFICHVVAD
jgi:DNA helicase-2/ATP-dependent DNA helicase PcrA